MNKYILITILFFIFNASFAQKIKEKKGQIFVDKKEILFIEKIKLAGNVDFIVKDLNGKDLINFVMKDYYDPNKVVTKTDSRGVKTTTRGTSVFYYEIYFTGIEGYCESGYIMPTTKGVAKFVIKNQLANSETGTVDLVNAEKFINRIGKEESRRRDEINGNKVIIIQNNTPQTKEKDGITLKKGNVKINIGN